MKNFEAKLNILNKTIKEMFEHGVQILDPDDANYRISFVFYDAEKDKTYFSIRLVKEEEE